MMVTDVLTPTKWNLFPPFKSWWVFWLPQSVEYGRSDTRWLPRLGLNKDIDPTWITLFGMLTLWKTAIMLWGSPNYHTEKPMLRNWDPQTTITNNLTQESKEAFGWSQHPASRSLSLGSRHHKTSSALPHQNFSPLLYTHLRIASPLERFLTYSV